MARPRKVLNFEPVLRWGVSDFQRTSEYPKSYSGILANIAGLNKHQHAAAVAAAWKWEFLRRTDAYRTYWQKYRFAYSAEKYEDYWHPVWRIRGLLPDPRKSYARVHPHGLYEELLPPPASVRSYNIDSSKSLQPQLDAIMDNIIREQKAVELIKQKCGVIYSSLSEKASKTSKQRFLKFLRALDAKEANASYALLDEVINRQAVGRAYQGHATYNQAVKLQMNITGLSGIDMSRVRPALLPRTFR